MVMLPGFVVWEAVDADGVGFGEGSIDGVVILLEGLVMRVE